MCGGFFSERVALCYELFDVSRERVCCVFAGSFGDVVFVCFEYGLCE